jgi:hypothetical protein
LRTIYDIEYKVKVWWKTFWKFAYTKMKLYQLSIKKTILGCILIEMNQKCSFDQVLTSG